MFLLASQMDMKFLPNFSSHVWDFKKVNTNLIRKIVKMGNWHFMLLNKAFHDQISTFTIIMMNIFTNYGAKYVRNKMPWGV